MSYQCVCIKCHQKFSSEKVDDQFEAYCPNCFTKKMQIAKEIDAKFAGRDHNADRNLRYDELPKWGNTQFVSAKSLGL